MAWVASSSVLRASLRLLVHFTKAFCLRVCWPGPFSTAEGVSWTSRSRGLHFPKPCLSPKTLLFGYPVAALRSIGPNWSRSWWFVSFGDCLCLLAAFLGPAPGRQELLHHLCESAHPTATWRNVDGCVFPCWHHAGFPHSNQEGKKLWLILTLWFWGLLHATSCSMNTSIQHI